MAFHLTQKHCQSFRKNGWHTVLAGSKFTTGMESRYAPVEGGGP